MFVNSSVKFLLFSKFSFFCLKPDLFLVTVPPAYYAHLGAFRARYYIEDDNSDQSVAVKQLPKIDEHVQQFMFYC